MLMAMMSCESDLGCCSRQPAYMYLLVYSWWPFHCNTWSSTVSYKFASSRIIYPILVRCWIVLWPFLLKNWNNHFSSLRCSPSPRGTSIPVAAADLDAHPDHCPRNPHPLLHPRVSHRVARPLRIALLCAVSIQPRLLASTQRQPDRCFQGFAVDALQERCRWDRNDDRWRWRECEPVSWGFGRLTGLILWPGVYRDCWKMVLGGIQLLKNNTSAEQYNNGCRLAPRAYSYWQLDRLAMSAIVLRFGLKEKPRIFQ